MTEPIILDRRAVLAGVAVVSRIQPADLARDTPCAAWSLRDLLAHMIGQHLGFAASADAAGGPVDLAEYAPRPVGDHPATEYARSAERVLAAFGRVDVGVNSSGVMHLPEIRGGVTVPVATAVGFHLVDYVVHAWDVAASLAVPVRFDAQVLAAASRVAAAVPAEAKTAAAATPFGPPVAAPGGDALRQLLAELGRDPDWTPSAR